MGVRQPYLWSLLVVCICLTALQCASADNQTKTVEGSMAMVEDSLPPCSAVNKSRAGIVALARSLVGKKLIYTQKSPEYEFYGIVHKTCPDEIPKYSSAFGFIAWMFWTAYGNGPDFVRNCTWGNCSAQVMTNTTGRQVTLAEAKPGDVVVWWGTHGWPLLHGALYVGNETVVTMGYYFQDKMFLRTVLYRNITWWKKNGFYPYGYTIRTYDEVV